MKANKLEGNKKLIILGTAPTLNLVPWDQDEYDYWACSPVLSYEIVRGHRIDAVLEIHERKHWNSIEIKKMLKNFISINPKSIIYMQDKYKEIKNSESYPLKEIQKMVNNELLGKYFTSSIGFLVALSVFKKYSRIELWGCHMSALEEEYSKQRKGVEAWLNYALGKGIDYWVHPESELMRSSYIYGYEQRKDTVIKLMKFKESVVAGVAHYDKILQKAKNDYHEQKGGNRIIDLLINDFKN